MTQECTGALGSGGAGSTPLGSASYLAVAEAREVSRNSVRVTFSTAPVASDPATAWDALNPENWRLEPLSPHGIVVRLAQVVRRVAETAVDVFFDGPLDAPATYRIVVENVREVGGGEISLDEECRAAAFATFPLFRVPPARARAARVDLANPQLLNDEKVTNPLGTFQINDRGDFALESGRAYLRKRILRRATSALGSFFHLPAYGFEQPLKGLIKPSVIRSLQSAVLAQVLREPDVAKAAVEVFLARSDILVISIKVVDTNGEADQMTVPVPLSS